MWGGDGCEGRTGDGGGVEVKCCGVKGKTSQYIQHEILYLSK